MPTTPVPLVILVVVVIVVVCSDSTRPGFKDVDALASSLMPTDLTKFNYTSERDMKSIDKAFLESEYSVSA